MRRRTALLVVAASALLGVERVANAQGATQGLLGDENLFAAGLLKFLEVFPKLDAAFARISDPAEVQQYRRGLGNLESELKDLLAWKEKLLTALDHGTIDAAKLENARINTAETASSVGDALQFLDPRHYGHVFAIGAADAVPLRSQFNEMSDSIRSGLSAKDAATRMLSAPGPIDVPQIVEALKRSKALLETALKKVRAALARADRLPR